MEKPHARNEAVKKPLAKKREFRNLAGMSVENLSSKEALIRYVNRQQMSWRAVDVEKLVGEDHPARALGELAGRLDLCRFYEAIESNAEKAGEARVSTTDPQARVT